MTPSSINADAHSEQSSDSEHKTANARRTLDIFLVDNICAQRPQAYEYDDQHGPKDGSQIGTFLDVHTPSKRHRLKNCKQGAVQLLW